MTRPSHALVQEAGRPRIERAGGAVTTQMVTPEIGAEAFLNGFTTIAPGGAIAMHFHDCEESVLVVSGRANVEVNGVRFLADEGDVTWLPAGVPHRFLNASKDSPLKIFWTYASVTATRTLVETGRTEAILAEAGTRG